jgi:ribose transport system substrate-binding protein
VKTPRRTWGLVATVALASLALGVVAAAKTSKPAAAAPQATVVIGYSDPLASEEGLRAVGYGARQAIKQLKLPWTLKELDSKLSADKQVSDIDTFVSLKAKGIMSWTLDPGAADAAYKRARDAGIAVIGLNSNSKYFNSVMAANTDTTCLVANAQAAYIAKLVPRAKVLAIGGPPVPSITLTTDCFTKAAKRNGLTILELQKDTTGSQAGGQKIAESMLLKHSDAQAMWVFSDGDALGASAALAAAGKQVWSGKKKGVVLVSRNGIQAAIDAIKAGRMTATWDNNQPLLGAAAVQILKRILVDKVPAAKIPKRVAIPSQRWDLGTIGTYKSPLKRAVPLPLGK